MRTHQRLFGRRNCLALIGTAALIGSGPSRAQDVTVQRASAPRNIEERWRDWLQSEGRSEGENRLPDGSTTVLARAVVEIQAAPGAANWVAVRTAAFESADLLARGELGRYVGTLISSNREYTMGAQGGEEAPPAIIQARSALSNAERLRTLTGLTLDEAIRQFDPQWDGTGRTEADRQAVANRIATDFRQRLGSRASVLATGAMTPVQFEGLNGDGKMAVLVGVVWSDRLQRLAEGLWSPTLEGAGGPPGQSLQDRIEAENRRDPAWMSATNGVRIWRDERGEKVLVAFGAAPATQLSSMDRSRARLGALAALQRFVAEQVEAADGENTALSFRGSTTNDGQAFDNSAYQNRIRARANDITISGATITHEWRGVHPIGRANMQVVMLAWSPSSDAAARRVGGAMSSAGERMRRQGAAPEPEAGTARNAASPSAVPTRSGASTDPGDF
ncbi:hypothetical protein [Teichococcus vastitatis]|uniref:hypothetical protein n=1 Tax=Teichococcus vastitatis TaxID=2307076 RepID=UPI0013003017|nr:hypothetical protein [Pseudoroseomonas vastitatis]